MRLHNLCVHKKITRAGIIYFRWEFIFKEVDHHDTIVKKIIIIRIMPG